jgi:hypothetical protein
MPSHTCMSLPNRARQNRVRPMRAENNELVYQAVDPDLAERMKNLGCVVESYNTGLVVLCTC